MRRGTAIGIILLAACSGPPAPEAAEPQELAVIPTPSAARTLGEVYAAYALTPAAAEGQRAYFEAFPRDYPTLRKLFGFEEMGEDSVAFGEYYEQGNDMIGAFFQLDSLPEEGIAKKAIGIARNGEWQEDGVGYFQLFLMKDLEMSPAVYLAALDPLPRADQAGFWKFYTDGPEAYPQEDKSRLSALLAKEPGQLALLDSVLALQRGGH